MAQRPVFIPHFDGPLLVRTVSVTFDWFPGLSVSQKQRSIESLHAAARQLPGVSRVLEVSSKSKEQLGTALSAFNLTLPNSVQPGGLSVECAFQGSKVFEQGGPYSDIYGMSSREAKRDDRLRTSGSLTGFRFLDLDWPLEPQTAFYDWLYINALRENLGLTKCLDDFSAFTDIEFNPEKSINCQAYAVALYVSLLRRGILEAVTLDKDTFLHFLRDRPISNAQQDDTRQGFLF
ncbi:hypothetical protein C3Y89_24230 [Rhizobium sp. UPM1132]|uniref:DarT1-associated NADAR antitoxin family protein n=1 Tax=Rhizobium ruizarguesonis TaxID=2081791 RepID=UPI0014450841|nr:hypothetical protein [Rhizobium ruizarguesonis]NKQ73416.1 hypothetical protein [Rhizobium ruizarguesonis]